MDSFVDGRDYRLLENDKYTFFVLGRIMGGECDLLLTDHERLIICFSSNPHPVWIWMPDDVMEEEKEKAYELIRENGLLTEGHTFNLKYDLADYFIRRSSEDAMALSIKTNMFAYDCPNPVEPHIRTDGELLDVCRRISTVIHTGRRNLGIQVMELYQQLAIDLKKGGYRIN